MVRPCRKAVTKNGSIFDLLQKVLTGGNPKIVYNIIPQIRTHIVLATQWGFMEKIIPTWILFCLLLLYAIFRQQIHDLLTKTPK